MTNLFLSDTNKTDAGQPAHQFSLIGAYFVHFSTLPILTSLSLAGLTVMYYRCSRTIVSHDVAPMYHLSFIFSL